MKQLWEISCKYIYVPRLLDINILTEALRGFSRVIFGPDEAFALASGKDPETGRYRDIRLPNFAAPDLPITDTTLLVHTDIAQVDLNRSRADAESGHGPGDPTGREWTSADGSGAGGTGATRPGSETDGADASERDGAEPLIQPDDPTRYQCQINVSPYSASATLLKAAEEIINRFLGMGAEQNITLIIEATNQAGFSEGDRRVIEENSRTLGFDLHEFE